MGKLGNKTHLDENKKKCERMFYEKNIIYPLPNKINRDKEFSFTCIECNKPYEINFRQMNKRYDNSDNILLCRKCTSENTRNDINYDEIRREYDNKIKYDENNIPYMESNTIPRNFCYKNNTLNEYNHKYVFMKYFLPTLNNIDKIYYSNINIRILNKLFGGQYFKGTTYVEIITIKYKNLILEHFKINEYIFYLWFFDGHVEWNNELIKQYLDWLIYDIKGYKSLDDAYYLSVKDFRNNKGGGIYNILNKDIFNILCEYYPEHDWKIYKFNVRNGKKWNDINCKNAIIDVFGSQRNILCSLNLEVFKNNGLSSLYNYWYLNKSKYSRLNVIPSLMIELFPEHNFKSTEFINYKLEIKISESIKNIGYEDSPQHKFEDCRDKNTLPFDNGIIGQLPINILIEGDGEQHFYVNKFFGGIEGFKLRVKHDLIKNRYILENNMILVRISYNCIEQTEKLINQAIIWLKIVNLELSILIRNYIEKLI